MNRWQHNPNRYLFNNHGWWWMKYSPYDPVYTERVNINLKTRDLEEARQRRDLKLAQYTARVVERTGGVAEQLALDLFPAPTWQTCRHDCCHDTHAVVPVGLFCMNCNTLLLQYLPEPPEVLGYVSADWAWHYEQGNAWTTQEADEEADAFGMWVRNPRARREVAA